MALPVIDGLDENSPVISIIWPRDNKRVVAATCSFTPLLSFPFNHSHSSHSFLDVWCAACITAIPGGLSLTPAILCLSVFTSHLPA
jgi:hypothetical protein